MERKDRSRFCLPVAYRAVQRQYFRSDLPFLQGKQLALSFQRADNDLIDSVVNSADKEPFPETISPNS